MDAALPTIFAGAESGDARAQYLVATMLFNGDHVPEDRERAHVLMRSAAAAGLWQASESLAIMEGAATSADTSRIDPAEEPLMSQADRSAALRILATLAPRQNAEGADTLEGLTRSVAAELLRGRLGPLVVDALARQVGAASD